MADRFTAIPNWLIEAMPQMPASVFQVAVVIARQTVGYDDGNGGRKEWDRLSLSKFEQATGLSRQGVLNALDAGLGKWFERRETGQWFEYKLVNSVDQSTQCTSQLSVPVVVNSVDQFDPKLVNSVDTQKKEIKQKKEKGEGAAAPPTRPAHATAKALHLDPKRRTLSRLDSLYLDLNRFDANGFIPPGTGSNAAEVFHERRSIYAVKLTAPNEDDLVRNCPDLDRLREVIAVCDRRGYRAANIDVILDLYRKGTHHGTAKHNGAAPDSPASSTGGSGPDDDIPFDEERTRAAMAETQRRVAARLAAKTGRAEARV